MAVIIWPSSLSVISTELQTVNPGQVVHQVPATASVQVLEFGHGSWVGTAEIGPMKDGSVAEAFFAAMDGASNEVEMPLLRDTISESVRINAVNSNVVTLASTPDGLKIGAYLRVARRLFLIVSLSGSQSSPEVGLWPYNPQTIGNTVNSADTIRVRSRGAPVMRRVRGGYGPWTFRWRQAPE